MEIEVSNVQARVPVTVCRLTGSLTEAEKLETAVRQAYDAGGRNFLLDMGDVDYISSAGLRALHTIFDLLRDKNSPAESDEAMKAGIVSGTFKSPHLKLLKPSKKVLQVLQISGYDMFLDIHKNRQAAIDSF